MKNSVDTKKVIIDAAFKVFGNNGFGNTTIKDIAREAGIAPGSIYNHFSDKEDLFRSTVQEGWDQFLLELQNIISSSMSIKEKYRNVIDVAFDLLKTGQPLLKGMLFDANERELVQDNIDKFIDYLLEFFKQRKMTKRLFQNIDEKQRRFFLTLMIMGILLNVSLCSPRIVDEEIRKMKIEVYRLIESE